MESILSGGPIFTAQDDQLHHNWAIHIQGEKIAAVGPLEELLSCAPAAQRVDVGGRTLLPGLVDAHRHVIGASAADVTPELIAYGAITGVRVAQETLAAGITTVRDPGCKHAGIFALKRAIADGLIPGPAIYASGPNPTGGAAPSTWRNRYVCGPWEMRQAVRELARDGADWIKLVVSQATPESNWQKCIRYLTDLEIRAAVEEAHALDMKISAHTEGLDAARSLIDAGADALEHASYLDEEAAERMAQQGMFLVPTLWLFTHNYDSSSTPPDQLDAYRRYQDGHSESFQRALRAGVKIAAGTDAVTPLPPADCLVVELELMQTHGMAVAAILQAATAGGAGVLGLNHSLGQLAVGCQADVIAVNGNPLADLRALTQVDWVMQRGRIVLSTLESKTPLSTRTDESYP
ncbi:MAG: amidohydrolase family protein [Caldilinea sp.]|jgi:imidazolonepropionase-like amidohydrolase